MEKEKPIMGFQGEHRFLSNFWGVEIYLGGQNDPYPSVENAYQACKTTNAKLREIFRKYSARDAKTLGQNIIVRSDWNDELRIETMRKLLFQKFDSRDIELTQRLLATGNAELVESNDWNDTFFGVCKGEGTNHLGKLLMEVRSQLKSEKDTLYNFLVNNVSSKTIAEHLCTTEKMVEQKKRAYYLLFVSPNGTPTQSSDWDDANLFIQQNPKQYFDGFPFSVPFPKMYGGQEYEIITVSGEKFTARVDDSREFMAEGLEWKTIGKNRDGNKERSVVVAWKLLTK